MAVSGVLILLSMVLGMARLALGETAFDRVIAVDLLTIVSLSVIALAAHAAGRLIYLDVALVYGLLSFLGVLAVARYMEQGL
jgi:multicomponent Na+:H+ antiporter subunit F